MRRIGIILTAMMLMMTGMTAAHAGQETLVYASAFGAGTDLWYARGAQKVYHTTEATLRTEGRTSDWHSPGRNFELAAGTRYDMSVEVLQNEAETATLMVSVQVTKEDGSPDWKNLFKGEVKKGEWTTLSGSYTPDPSEDYILYVETVGAPELSYEIRNFRVVAPDGVPDVQPTATPATEFEAVVEMPSLKDLYAGKFDFGTALPRNAFNDMKLLMLVKEQFNILTPENEMKPDAILDVYGSRKLAAEDETAVAVKFDACKTLLRFAQANGLKVHGHTLLWHNQTPEALFHEGYDTSKPLASREVMLGRMENYIRQVLTWTEENYPGVIVSWDVVNEAIDDGTNKLRTGANWYKTVGPDYLARAFEYARKYAAEGVLLYYNDYNTAYSGKLYGIFDLLKSLMAEGNIDGYGFQMHHSLGEPSMDMITRAVEKIASLGLKLRVSELDINAGKPTEQNFQSQKNKYKQVMKLMLRFKDQTEAVQVWGVIDTMSWRRDGYPLLFDKNMNPKPAFFGVAEAAQEDQ